MDIINKIEDISKNTFYYGNEYKVIGYRKEVPRIKEICPIGTIVIVHEQHEEKDLIICSKYCSIYKINNKCIEYRIKGTNRLLWSCYIIVEGE